MEKLVFPLSILIYFSSVSPPLFHTLSQRPNYLVVSCARIFLLPCKKEGIVKLKFSRGF